MRNEFIPYKEALALKELGFDEPCFYMWNIDTKELFSSNSTDINGQPTNLDLIGNVDFTAPLYQQAFRWFREEYNLRGFIGFRPNVKQFDYHIYDMSLSGIEYAKQRTMEEFNKDPKVGTYEEAELACLKKLIEIINQNKNG